MSTSAKGPLLPGKIKWFDAAMGFGFILPDVGNEDVFLHKIVVQRCGIVALPENQKVRYCAEPSPSGRVRASYVEVVN